MYVHSLALERTSLIVDFSQSLPSDPLTSNIKRGCRKDKLCSNSIWLPGGYGSSEVVLVWVGP
jgi:hypothetical protein